MILKKDYMSSLFPSEQKLFLAVGLNDTEALIEAITEIKKINILFKDHAESLSMASLNRKDLLGETAVMVAAQYGKKACLEILIKYGADLNIRNKEGRTALILSAFAKEWECFKALMESNDLDLEVQDKDGNTALHYAAENGHEEICKSLMAKMENIEIRNHENYTPRHMALSNHKVSCYELLIRHKELKQSLEKASKETIKQKHPPSKNWPWFRRRPMVSFDKSKTEEMTPLQKEKKSSGAKKDIIKSR
jgi:ankyrin repeat protein